MTIKQLLMKYFSYILVLLFCISCARTESLTTPLEDTTNEEQITYLALGDSYTIGESVETSLRYPVQLANQLKQDFDIVAPKIIARTGWTSSELQNAITQENIQDTFDMVSLLIGVNNQFRGQSIETYKLEFRQLLEQAIGFAGGKKEKVFVISIPDYAFTPFGQSRDAAAISAGIDAFNAVNKNITMENNIRYFNITPVSRRGLDEPSLVASDGLHPSGTQYLEWVNLMSEEVKILLEKD